MDFTAYQALEFERRGRVLVIRLNRPEQMNAVNAQLHAELSRVFYDANADRDSDVVVLTGNGRAFCAGGDIGWMQSSVDRPEEFEITAREAKHIVFSQLDLEKPLICRLNGHATGLGASLALLSDIIVAHDRVKIGDPHVSVGLVAGDGGAIIWPQLVGYARAKEYLMTGDPVPTTEAERIDLVNHVVPDAELDERVDAFAARLAGGAVQAIKYSKVSVNIGLKQLAHSILDTSIGYEMLTFTTEDHKEAVRSFLEKRKPNFTGR